MSSSPSRACIAPGCEEEERLEKGVSHEVEDSGGEDANPAADEHVSKLADGGVGQHPLEIVLCKGNRRRKEGRHTPNHAHNFQSKGCV
jgi:hypothetical protein